MVHRQQASAISSRQETELPFLRGAVPIIGQAFKTRAWWLSQEPISWCSIRPRFAYDEQSAIQDNTKMQLDFREGNWYKFTGEKEFHMMLPGVKQPGLYACPHPP